MMVAPFAAWMGHSGTSTMTGGLVATKLLLVACYIAARRNRLSLCNKQTILWQKLTKLKSYLQAKKIFLCKSFPLSILAIHWPLQVLPRLHVVFDSLEGLERCATTAGDREPLTL